MSKTINLADLRDNPELAKELMQSTTKKKKTLKTQKKKPKTIAILPVEEEEPKVIVKHDDDTSEKQEAIEQYIRSAESYFNQSKPVYASMEIMFSAAYRFADSKSRPLLVQARGLCKEALSREEKYKKTRERLKAKNLKLSKKDAKKFYTSEIKDRLKTIFEELYKNIALDASRRAGTAYNEIHKQYTFDLSQHDDSAKVITLSRANLIISVGNHVDTEDVKRSTKHVQIEHLESTIFVIRNALIVGYAPHALPRKIDAGSLEVSMANAFQIKATPIPTQLRHPTSSRIWFYVPEYQKILIKSLAFADRSINSEFEAFKSLSNDPTEEDVRFLFIRAGVDAYTTDTVIRRWKACDSYQGRLAILTNEYNTLKQRQKSNRLKLLREGFISENEELYESMRKAEDRLHFIDEVKTDIRVEFSTLASHTGRPEHGLPIAKRERLTEAFNSFERAAVRGLVDSHERIKIRAGIRQDRFKCRKLIQEYKEVRKETSQLNAIIKNTSIKLKALKEFEFRQVSGKLDELELD